MKYIYFIYEISVYSLKFLILLQRYTKYRLLCIHQHPWSLIWYRITIYDEVQLQMDAPASAFDSEGLNCTRMMKYVNKAP